MEDEGWSFTPYGLVLDMEAMDSETIMRGSRKALPDIWEQREVRSNGRFASTMGMAMAAVAGIAFICHPKGQTALVIGKRSGIEAFRVRFKLGQRHLGRIDKDADYGAAVQAVLAEVPTIYRDVRAARFDIEGLRHRVAGAWPSFRLPSTGAAEVELREEDEQGFRLGGAVWPPSFYAEGRHDLGG